MRWIRVSPARPTVHIAKVNVVINPDYQFMNNGTRRAFMFGAVVTDSALATRQAPAQMPGPMQEGSDAQALARPAQACSVSQRATKNEKAP
jgi:hypothetical protein